MKAPLCATVNGEARASALAMYSHETGGQEDDGIDESNDPLVSPGTSQTKFLREGQVGPVGSSLIPSLRGGSDGTQRDRIPKHGRAVPFVVPLVHERTALLFIKLGDHLESFWVPRDESRPTEQSGVLGHTMRLGKSPGIDDSPLRGAALWEGRGWASMLDMITGGAEIAKLTFRGFSTMLRATDLRRPSASAGFGLRA